MTATLTQARDDLLSAVSTAWGATGPVDYEDQPNTVQIPPDGAIPWIRVTIRHTTGRQATLSNAIGARRFRRFGVILVQVFSPLGSSMRDPETHTNLIVNALEGITTENGVITRNVRINEIGSEGIWFQTNVVADFEYDQIK